MNKEFFEAAPRVIGVLTFSILVLTVVHETGYFVVLGPHLQTVATTFDYFTNSLVWLPTSIGLLLAVQSIEIVLKVQNNKIRMGWPFYFEWAVAGIARLRKRNSSVLVSKSKPAARSQRPDRWGG
jgi:hypothetical protein